MNANRSFNLYLTKIKLNPNQILNHEIINMKNHYQQKLKISAKSFHKSNRIFCIEDVYG